MMMIVPIGVSVVARLTVLLSRVACVRESVWRHPKMRKARGDDEAHELSERSEADGVVGVVVRSHSAA